MLVVGPRGLFGHEGGIEKFADEFVPRALGVADVSVLCLNKPARDLHRGLEILRVPSSKRFKTDKALFVVYALYYYATHRFHHVFILGSNFSVLVPLLKLVFWRRAKIHLRSGSIDHKFDKWGRGMRLFMRLSERVCRYADTIIAVSPAIKFHLENLGIHPLLVPNGLNKVSPTDKEIPREPNTIVAIGRVTEVKNYSTLIEASQAMGKDGPEITVIGGADLSGESTRLERLLEERPLAKVTFAGVKDRSFVLERLKAVSLYVNCSYQEGMSNAVLEAIEQGTPLIVSDIDANRALKLPGHFYFTPSDVQSFVLKMKEALENPKAFVVSGDLFDDWDSVIKRVLSLTRVI